MLQHKLFWGLSLTLALAFPAVASAATWSEVGDAGNLPATAQTPSGPGTLTSISGSISPNSDVDMFRIFINGGVPFFATTVGTAGTLVDTQLFLFNSSGIGVVMNDDADNTTFRSTIPDTSLSSGLYYLAISGWDIDPQSIGGDIFFEDTDPNETHDPGVYGPTGPGGAFPVSGWPGEPDFEGSTYTIALRGASAVPEPTSMALLATGALPFLRRLRRRRMA
jgi:hypothetical protein